MQESEIRTNRINELKGYKEIIKIVINENKSLKPYETGWRAQFIDNNISDLKNLAVEINRDLQKENLNNYVEAILNPDKMYSAPFTQMNGLTFAVRIPNYTISNTLTYDINWLLYGDIKERLEISMGIKKVDELGKYLKNVIIALEDQVIPFLSKDKAYSNTVRVLKEAITLAQKKSYLSSNILLFSVAESLSRSLAKFVYASQNPKKTLKYCNDYIDNFNSLPEIITKVDWSNDLVYKTHDLVLEYGYLNDQLIMQAKNDVMNYDKSVHSFKKIVNQTATKLEPFQNITDVSLKKELNDMLLKNLAEMQKVINSSIDIKTHETRINFKIRLHFLTRRHTQNRNEILHGTYRNFNSKWKCFISLATIEEITKVIKQFKQIYSSKRKIDIKAQ